MKNETTREKIEKRNIQSKVDHLESKLAVVNSQLQLLNIKLSTTEEEKTGLLTEIKRLERQLADRNRRLDEMKDDQMYRQPKYSQAKVAEIKEYERTVTEPEQEEYIETKHKANIYKNKSEVNLAHMKKESVSSVASNRKKAMESTAFPMNNYIVQNEEEILELETTLMKHQSVKKGLESELNKLPEFPKMRAQQLEKRRLENEILNLNDKIQECRKGLRKMNALTRDY